MLKIPAVDGTYTIECISDGTYHELVSKLVGSFEANVSVSIVRQGSSQVELLNSLPVNVAVFSSGLIFGTLSKILITLTTYFFD